MAEAVVVALRASHLEREDSERWLRALLRRAGKPSGPKNAETHDEAKDHGEKEQKKLLGWPCLATYDVIVPTFERMRTLADRMLEDAEALREGGFQRIACVRDAKGWDVIICGTPGRLFEARTQGFALLRVHLYRDGGLRLLRPCDLAWSRRVLWLLDLRVGLRTANAYISTLGGGHFLCRQLDQAENMALRQLAVAYWLGDPVLASQCRIHLAYNIMQRGKLGLARWWILREWNFVHRLDHDLLKSMLRSAWHYRRQLVRHRHVLTQTPQDRLRDSFARQRFVS
ncbi:Hypothetical Protein FCC1311_023442 [Hondaea fermentalgiana]|uniref:Uncharacterized protein n=1 Tax=Hondaea fermentalgiana TaxID=2315210 RepID=A0A2R5GE89_9STRA|nr:Hypothetical Protein FCC1311_023442 [Hondaea fermentalgiana]|eukprot:GBG26124.1 Hypothetical Protein FCC1311_023442 [Hondaea fermentalgiana]